MAELELVIDNTDKKNPCLYCLNEAPAGQHFCSQWCYECWFEMKQANLLKIILDLCMDGEEDK